jgi:hypothetical protein
LKQRIVALCPLTRAFEPRSCRLYDVRRLSALGGIDADAIVKSSTNLQNSVSLNSRMLAYAATMRKARIRAWRSPQRRVISLSTIIHTLPCGQPSVPETDLQKSTKHILQIALSANGAANTVSRHCFSCRRDRGGPKVPIHQRIGFYEKTFQSVKIAINNVFSCFRISESFDSSRRGRPGTNQFRAPSPCSKIYRIVLCIWL